jgi:hypothetical protein
LLSWNPHSRYQDTVSRKPQDYAPKSFLFHLNSSLSAVQYWVTRKNIP